MKLDALEAEEQKYVELIGQRVGNYVLERPLKSGGMGSVYVAKHPALGREVAVKFLDLETGVQGEFSKRFLDEARITAGLQHPNVVNIFDFGDLNGRIYYVMELLNGRDLGEELDLNVKIPFETTLDYIIQICRGLQAAHSAGIVHRDLKPGNIFVQSGTPTRIKLMDFGVAKILSTDGSQTNYGQILGTPAYMAPEQAMGDVARISPQTDIYALGAIAYEMLGGRKPFVHESPMMLLVAHIHEHCAKLASLAGHIPAQLAHLIDTCLEKDPQLRPESAQHLADQLERFLQDSKTELALEPIDTMDELALTERGANQANPVLAQEHPENFAPTQRFDADDFSGPTMAPPPPPVDQGLNATLLASRGSSPETMVSQQAICQPIEKTHAKPPAPLVSIAPIEIREKESASAPPSTRKSAPPPPPLLLSEVPPPTLEESDKGILHKLLARMRRKGDLPAFVANVGDVNKKADFQGKFSADQLSETILKDHALTAKLLRIVNTNYLKRFGGRIFSVQQAIVILGFDQVRSIALSISVFSKRGAHSERVADSSLHSLVSGELARTLANRTGVKDTERATVCAMFQNLGRHLAIVYLPDVYDKILTRSKSDKISLNRAAEKEVGLSLRKLGIGVAEQWHLPPVLLEAMTGAHHDKKLENEDERVAALCHFSNDLCELVSEGLSDPEDSALKRLLKRHENLITIEPEEIPELLTRAQEAFRDRYSSLMGKEIKGSKFMKNLHELAPLSKRSRDALISRVATAGAPRAEAQNTENQVAIPIKKNAAKKRNSGGKRAVQALTLGASHPRPAYESQGEAPTKARQSRQVEKDALSAEGSLQELKEELDSGGDIASVLLSALKGLCGTLRVSRCILLRPNPSETEVSALLAYGEGADALLSEARFSISSSPSSTDIFSRAYFSGKNILIKDTFSDKSTSQLPQRYFEVFGSPALALLTCRAKSKANFLTLIDVEDPVKLPSRSSLEALRPLQELIGDLSKKMTLGSVTE